MKKTIRIICLMMALVMLCLCGASCAKSKTATISIKFIGVDDDGKEMEYFKHPNYTVVGSKGEQPSVLDAAVQVLTEFEKVYELSADGNSLFAAFDLKEEQTEDAEKGYYKYWKCTINGGDSTSGRQSATKIYAGDEIVFTWTEGEKDRLDTVVEETTNPADYETEYIETEPEETEEEEAE